MQMTSQRSGLAEDADVTAAGGLVFVTADTTERTTATGDPVDLSTFSSLSLAAGTRIRIVGKARKSAGAGAIATVGLKINGTGIFDTGGGSDTGIWMSSAADQAEDGIFEVEFEVGETNYTNSLNGSFSRLKTSNIATGVAQVAFPTATITEIIIDGDSGSALITLAINDIRVYKYRNSA